MAKVRETVLFIEPPITKEEALAPRSSWYSPPDGYDGRGGGEAPSELFLDRMVYPHDRGPSERARDDSALKREEDGQVYRDERLRRSRDFEITEGNLTGQNPGPPYSFGKKGD